MTHLSHSSIIFISYKNDGTYYQKNTVRKYTLTWIPLSTFSFFYCQDKTFENRCSQMKKYSKVDKKTLQYDFRLPINAGAALHRPVSFLSSFCIATSDQTPKRKMWWTKKKCANSSNREVCIRQSSYAWRQFCKQRWKCLSSQKLSQLSSTSWNMTDHLWRILMNTKLNINKIRHFSTFFSLSGKVEQPFRVAIKVN